MPDAEHKEREAKRPGDEDRLVVGSDDAGLAVALECLGEFQDQCPGGLVLQRFERKRGTARVLDDA